MAEEGRTVFTLIGRRPSMIQTNYMLLGKKHEL